MTGWHEAERKALQAKIEARQPFLDFTFGRVNTDGSKQIGDLDTTTTNLGKPMATNALQTTLPWYFQMKAFYGEERSENPEEVEPQHLAPGDATVILQTL